MSGVCVCEACLVYHTVSFYQIKDCPLLLKTTEELYTGFINLVIYNMVDRLEEAKNRYREIREEGFARLKKRNEEGLNILLICYFINMFVLVSIMSCLKTIVVLGKRSLQGKRNRTKQSPCAITQSLTLF